MVRLYPAMVVKGIYTGVKGFATPMGDHGTVAFYPDNETAHCMGFKVHEIQYLD